MSELKFCQGPDCHTYKHRTDLKELRAVRLIKLEEDQDFIMAMETFATEDVWKIGLRNTLNRV
jgi:hypothetical protein